MKKFNKVKLSKNLLDNFAHFTRAPQFLFYRKWANFWLVSCDDSVLDGIFVPRARLRSSVHQLVSAGHRPLGSHFVQLTWNSNWSVAIEMSRPKCYKTKYNKTMKAIKFNSLNLNTSRSKPGATLDPLFELNRCYLNLEGCTNSTARTSKIGRNFGVLHLGMPETIGYLLWLLFRTV